MRGAAHHLGVTVSNLETAERDFYEPVLGWLGFEKIEALPEMSVWLNSGSGFAINLWQAKEEQPHRRYAPGFHHLAFAAESREAVDEFYRFLAGRGLKVLDAPAEYDEYAPGYYAVFFEGPDGLKFELVHMPAIPD